MMQAVQLLALCTLSYVGALDIFIDHPVLLLDCRSDSSQHMTESTTTSISMEAPVDPKELYNAARDGDLSFIKRAISQLPTSGLDLEWRNTDHWGGYTALHIAAEEDQPSIVAALLDAGADPNVQTPNGRTPMLIAAQNNRISVLRLLLDHKYQADVNLQEEDEGWTPVLTAAYFGHTGALELLLAHGGDPNKVDNGGFSPVQKASVNGHVEAVRMLIQAGAHVNYVRPYDGYTALHDAARNHKLDVARLLLESGADKNKQDNRGRTPAYMARDSYADSIAQLIDNY